MTKPPSDLRAPGKKLWNELGASFDFTDAEPLVGELCRIQDRLCEVRAQLAKDGLQVGGKAHPLLGIEVKLSGQFRNLWRMAGFADPAPMEKRGPGRPVGS